MNVRRLSPLSFLFIGAMVGAASAQSPAPFSIAGHVRDETGRTISGAKVCAVPLTGSIERVRDKTCGESDADGNFTINLTEAGRYEVTGEKLSAGYIAPYIPYNRDPALSIVEVAVDEMKRNATVSLSLGPRSGVISGKVIDEASDNPVRNFVVWVYQARAANAQTHEAVS